MKFPILTALILTFAAPQMVVCVTAHLEGCQDPAVIAKSLREIETKDWSKISFTVLQKMWPSEIHALDCEDGKYCTSGWSQDRIISGECECCELFFFSEPGKNNKSNQELENVIIHYSAPDRDEVIKTAREFAAALDMPASKIPLVGLKDDEDFSWKNEQKGLLWGLNVKVTHRGERWKAYLNVGRNKL